MKSLQDSRLSAFYFRMRSPFRQLVLLFAFCTSLTAGAKDRGGIVYRTCGPTDGPAFRLEIEHTSKYFSKTIITANVPFPDLAKKAATFQISKLGQGLVLAERCRSVSQCEAVESGMLKLEASKAGLVTGSYELSVPGVGIERSNFKVHWVEQKIHCG